jgi:hypothetical protein
MPAKKTASFTLTLTPPSQRGAMVPVVLPPEAHAALGGDKGRIPVEGTADGHPIRTSASPMGGHHLFPFNRDMQQATGKGPGDTVHFVLWRDEAPRTLEAPDDLAAALAKDARASAHWDALAYSHRREYVRWLEEAKKAETRERRVAEAVRMLAAGERRK